jgi:hypothetical protein
LRALQFFPLVGNDTLPVRSGLPGTPESAQEIGFGKVSTKPLGMQRFALTPVTSFGVPVTTSSATPDVCSVNQSLVELRAAGVCTVRATQPNLAAGFSQSCSTSYNPFCACMQTTCQSSANALAETRMSFAVTPEAEVPLLAQSSFFLKDGVVPASQVSVFAGGGRGNLTLSARLNLGQFQMPQAVLGGLKVYILAAVVSGGGSVTLLQKPPSGVWGPLVFPLSAYLENVALNAADNSVLIEIVAGVDFSALRGTEFYIGYGTSDTEMLASRRYRGIFKID